MEQKLKLEIGRGLTAEQIKNLDNDLIWYVEEVIEGETVLVPKLYLTELTRENMKFVDGAIFDVGDMDLDIENGNFENSGYLLAKNNMKIKAKNFINDSSQGGGYMEGDSIILNEKDDMDGNVVDKDFDNLANEINF